MAGNHQPLASLAALLEEERRLILSSDYRALESLLGQKTVLLAAIAEPQGDAEPRELAHVADAARRNQKLVAAASEGLGTAMRRLVELEHLHRGRGTYGAAGKRCDAVAGARIERRF